jgi:hypothetical protein
MGAVLMMATNILREQSLQITTDLLEPRFWPTSDTAGAISHGDNGERVTYTYGAFFAQVNCFQLLASFWPRVSRVKNAIFA